MLVIVYLFHLNVQLRIVVLRSEIAEYDENPGFEEQSPPPDLPQSIVRNEAGYLVFLTPRRRR